MSEYLLTTTDNPYNPFDNFDEWYAYDMQLAREQGRPTIPSYLARIARLSSRMTEDMESRAIDSAINEIVRFNITGKYRKISEEEAKTLI